MKAVCWNGINTVGVEDVPDPKLINPRDAIIQVTSTAICGSDLHLYDGYVPSMKKGDILGHAEVINYEGLDVVETLKQMTGGMGPDVCIDAVGMEAHKHGFEGFYDRAKQTIRMETDRPYVLREAIQACRKGGTISLAGVYGGFADTLPVGAAFNKGLTP